MTIDKEGTAEESPPRRRKSPSKQQCIEVWRRDVWLCRWCRRPVVFAPTMRLLDFESRFGGHVGRLDYYHANWARTFAPLLDELGATIDHVQSFRSGGAETTENFYAACTKCNYRKSDLEAGKFVETYPQKKVMARYGEPTSWDGLVSVFAALAIRHPKELTSSDKKWLEALRISEPPHSRPE